MADEDTDLLATEDLEADPDLPQLVEVIVRETMRRTRVAGPGLARSVDMSTGLVGVQPAIAAAGEDAEPIIPDVHLLQLRTSLFEITLPVAAGDSLQIIHSDRSLDEWSAGAGALPVQAGDARAHDITDAVAIPLGLGAADSANLVIRRRSGAGLVLIGGTASEATHPAINGDSYNTPIQSWMDAVDAALIVALGPLPPGLTVATKAAMTAALSSKVKVA